MNRSTRRLVAPLIAAALFGFVVVQTGSALQDSGVWRFGRRAPYVLPSDPLAELDGQLARGTNAPFAGASRDPFGYGAVASGPGPSRPVVRRPVVPPAPEVPVLTAIVYDADPRALVRWQGRDYTIRKEMMFGDFVVVSIARDQVVLRRGTEDLVLKRKPQGE